MKRMMPYGITGLERVNVIDAAGEATENKNLS